MKVNYVGWEEDTWEFHEENVPNKALEEIDDNIAVTTFPYKNQTPGIYKMVLHWNYTITTKQKRPLIKFIAEHEVIIQLDGDNDQQSLRQVFSNSKLQFRMKFESKVKGTRFEGFAMSNLDTNPLADDTLSDL